MSNVQEHMQKKSLALALKQENPLQIAGVINASCALLAEQAGFKALYLSGAGVSNADFGVPDVGLTSLTEVAEQVRRITAVTSLPVLVDADTGWGNELNVDRTVKLLEQAGAAGLHIEDQAWPKRCGHLSGKRLIDVKSMTIKIKAALAARRQSDFHIMIRTDALGVESMESALERMKSYVAAGADSLFAEAVTSLEMIQTVVGVAKVPVLVNLTEFGKTPLYQRDEMKQAGVRMLLYPLSAFRAMNFAAKTVYETIRREGTQQALLERMMTRAELYELLGYTP